METELKFKVTPELLQQLQDHPELQGEERRQRLRSVYFDTPDRDLRRCGLGLRVRDTGEGFIQTVKHQDGAGGFARGEWEAEAPSGGIDVEALSRTPAGEVLDGKLQRLEPVFSTTIDRCARLCRPDGAVIEAAFDSGEVSVGDRRQPICELELELKDGDLDALFGLGRRLVAEFSANLSFEGKAQQGYRLADGAEREARSAEASTLSPDMSAAQAFQRIAHACLAQAGANAELLLIVRRPEAIHQMRVGLRRLRAAFAAFKPMLNDGAHAGIEAELKWLAGELDLARDLDVFIQGLFRSAADETEDAHHAPLGRQLLKAQTEAYHRAVAAIRSQRYARLLFETAAWIETGSWSRSDDAVLAGLRARPVTAFAIDALDHLRAAVRRRGCRFEQLDPTGRHRLRIRAKRLRYATEFFGPLFEDAPRQKIRFLAALKRMQNQLGALNDLATARDQLLQDAALKRPEVAFAAGRIIGRRERDEAKLLQAAADEVDDFRSAAPFWRGAA